MLRLKCPCINQDGFHLAEQFGLQPFRAGQELLLILMDAGHPNPFGGTEKSHP